MKNCNVCKFPVTLGCAYCEALREVTSNVNYLYEQNLAMRLFLTEDDKDELWSASFEDYQRHNISLNPYYKYPYDLQVKVTQSWNDNMIDLKERQWGLDILNHEYTTDGSKTFTMLLV